MADRQKIWGDPRLLYGQMEQRQEEAEQASKPGNKKMHRKKSQGNGDDDSGMKAKLEALAQQKEDAAVSKTDDFFIYNEELCIKNEEFCNKNDGFCSALSDAFCGRLHRSVR